MGLTKSLYADLSCEEVFELERHCDEVRESNIVAQEIELAAQTEREDQERDLIIEEATCFCDICTS
jgi:hypothetical protein|tara:strand:- start:449 stop:646 length:198 start_codon:yes stop_codon:yes gene_type:complete